jgi:hypothetical protein
MQPYLSANYDSTISVMEGRLKTGAIKKPTIDVTDIDIDKKDCIRSLRRIRIN